MDKIVFSIGDEVFLRPEPQVKMYINSFWQFRSPLRTTKIPITLSHVEALCSMLDENGKVISKTYPIVMLQHVAKKTE